MNKNVVKISTFLLLIINNIQFIINSFTAYLEHDGFMGGCGDTIKVVKHCLREQDMNCVVREACQSVLLTKACYIDNLLLRAQASAVTGMALHRLLASLTV